MRPAILLLAAISFQSSPALDSVLSRLDTYLAGYEPRLSQVIADEDMSQTRPRAIKRGNAVQTPTQVGSSLCQVARRWGVARVSQRQVRERPTDHAIQRATVRAAGTRTR